MTDRKKADTARTGEARLVSVSRYGQQAGPSQLAETFLAGGGAPISDSGAILRWGVRRYAWLVLLCVAVVGVLLPFQELNKKASYTSESLVVAVDLTADLKTLPRLGEAVFDDGTVAQVVSQQFGTAGDAEDVIPKLASVVTEQDSLVMHVQGHSGNGQEAADIADTRPPPRPSCSRLQQGRVGSRLVPGPQHRRPAGRAGRTAAGSALLGVDRAGSRADHRARRADPAARPAPAGRRALRRGTGHRPAGVRHGDDAADRWRLAAGPGRGARSRTGRRQLLDWSPSTVIVTGPDTAAQERHHLSRLLGDVFAASGSCRCRGPTAWRPARGTSSTTGPSRWWTAPSSDRPHLARNAVVRRARRARRRRRGPSDSPATSPASPRPSSSSAPAAVAVGARRPPARAPRRSRW